MLSDWPGNLSSLDSPLAQSVGFHSFRMQPMPNLGGRPSRISERISFFLIEIETTRALLRLIACPPVNALNPLLANAPGQPVRNALDCLIKTPQLAPVAPLPRTSLPGTSSPVALSPVASSLLFISQEF